MAESVINSFFPSQVASDAEKISPGVWTKSW